MIRLPGLDPHPIISKGQRHLHWAFVFAFLLLISRNTSDKNKAEDNSTDDMNPCLDITAIFLIITYILKETNLFLTCLLVGLFVPSYSNTELPWRQNWIGEIAGLIQSGSSCVNTGLNFRSCQTINKRMTNQNMPGFLFWQKKEKQNWNSLGLLLCSICPEIERNPFKLFKINIHEKLMTK